MLRRLINACTSPLDTCRKLVGRVRKNSAAEPPHVGLWRQYDQLARAQGLDRLYLLLSFDCDTPEDIAAAAELDHWLAGLGLRRTYAVPGEQLIQGAETYRRLAESGADFINHGQRPHTEFRDGCYRSVTFYNEMTPEEVAQDIRLGHQTCLEVLGRPPRGFRAPHFGYYQKPDQREVLYHELRNLGYEFSSSTVPQLAFQQGPLIDVGELFEIPLSGSIGAPYSLLDSWNHVVSPEHPTVTDQYGELFVQTVDGLLNMDVAGILNYYVDPAHVRGTATFDRVIRYAVERELSSLGFSELLVKQKNAL